LKCDCLRVHCNIALVQFPCPVRCLLYICFFSNLGETFIFFNKQMKGNKREIIQPGVPLFQPTTEEANCMFRRLSASFSSTSLHWQEYAFCAWHICITIASKDIGMPFEWCHECPPFSPCRQVTQNQSPLSCRLSLTTLFFGV
jgi:hypothetical protein